MTARFAFSLGLALAALGCGSSHSLPPDGEAPRDGAVTDDGGIVKDSATVEDGGIVDRCEEPRPFCADGCGSDWEPEGPECVEGAWVCPPGTVDSRDCPSETCWGPPLPGEECEDGWTCRPDESDWELCPELLCATCDGFGEARAVGDCRCGCDEATGQVTCEREEPPPPPGDCEGLPYCECFERTECAVRSDGCLCPCDFMCDGWGDCVCGCGGGDYLGCGPAVGG